MNLSSTSAFVGDIQVFILEITNWLSRCRLCACHFALISSAMSEKPRATYFHVLTCLKGNRVCGVRFGILDRSRTVFYEG